jgi:mono/diheme cytochrome c family protein
VTAACLSLAGTWALSSCSSSTPVPSDPTLAKGQEVFNTNCVACHGANGGGITGPRLIGIGERMTEEQEIAKITDGVAGTAMPAWGTRLSADEIAAVAAYTRSLTPT